MRTRIGIILVAVGAVVIASSFVATADSGKQVGARLTGYAETPSLSVMGRGTFSAELARNGGSISYTLTYSGLSGDALFAHIHLGQTATAGGVAAFLCGGGTADECPGAAGTVSGTIVPSDVVGPADQGLAPGEFAELVAAMRFGATYVNVHTDLFPSGEIRGQITG